MSFWKNKKVLITGHSGFVGSWLSVVLTYFGAEIIGISLWPEVDSLYYHMQDDLDVKSYWVDLLKGEEIKKIVRKEAPEIIIHLAAFGFVKECYEKSYQAFSTNVMGTVNLFEAIKHCDSVRTILVVSSDKVYQNNGLHQNYLFTEQDNLGGIDIYSCSKTCEDMISQSYYEAFFKEWNKTVHIVRPGNILGGGDHIKSRLIPSILEGYAKKEPIVIRNRNAVRPWQHILDALDAYLTVIQRAYAGQEMNIYNVAAPYESQKSVGYVSDYLADKFGYEMERLEETLMKTDGAREAAYLGLNIDKIIQELKWHPKKTLSETLDDVYEFWERSHWESHYTICMRQVEKYYKY